MRLTLSEACKVLGNYTGRPWRYASDVVQTISTWKQKPTPAEQKALKRQAMQLQEDEREEASRNRYDTRC